MPITEVEKIWKDGELVDWADANVHLLTHGLHYASCVFEGERAYGGRVFRSTEHSERLKNSANILDFEIPYSVAEIDAAISMVATGIAVRVRLVGLAHPGIAAAVALARTQAAGIRFEIERSPDGIASLTVGPAEREAR